MRGLGLTVSADIYYFAEEYILQSWLSLLGTGCLGKAGMGF